MPYNFGTGPNSGDAEPTPRQKETPEASPADETTTIHVIDETDHEPLADETTTIHVVGEDAAPVAFVDPDDVREPPRFPRRAFLIGGGLLVATTAAGVLWRLMPQTGNLPEDATDGERELVNEPGAVPEETDDGTYVVGEDLEPGIYTVECAEGGAKAGWLSYQTPEAGAPRTWPEVAQTVRVTVSAQVEGATIELAEGSRFVDAAPVDDLADNATHAGLFLVGTDMAPGSYELSAMTADEWCETEFGADAPVDDTHPTLWHKTCARAASATRAASRDIESWRGYVLCDPATAGDVTATIEDGAPSSLELLSDEDPTVGIEGEIGSGETIDSYLAWLTRHGLVQVGADETITVELTEGQLFAPVMMSVERKA